MLAIAGCSASDGTTAQNKPAGVAERAPSADCSRFDYARCIALSPTERMRGVWLSGFERSSFLAGAEAVPNGPDRYGNAVWVDRSEEHTSELQSLMRISYAVFCLKKTKKNKQRTYTIHIDNAINHEQPMMENIRIQ